jgi:hypothetical protein
MDKTPFSLYDFFGYLAPGFLALVALDYAATGGTHLNSTPSPILAIFWTLAAYVTGHVIASLSGFLFEGIFVAKLLRAPEENLLSANVTAWRKIFPSYYEPLPHTLRVRVRVPSQKTGEDSARAIFSHCRVVVRKDPATRAILDTFLNLYGFCRNVSMSLMIVAAVMFWGLLRKHQALGEWSQVMLWWVATAIIASIGMFYRYLKFFRKYTKEVFVAYAEGGTEDTTHL